jgi:hypothetical protein
MSMFQASVPEPLVRLGAWAAIAGGVLRILAAFIPYQASSAPLELLYAVIDVGLLFGLIAIYLATAAATGRTGLAGFAMALLGIASILGPDAPAFGIDFYLAGSFLFLLGLAALSAGLLRARQLGLAAAAWLLALVLAILGAVSTLPWLILAAGLALGAGFVAAGTALARNQA